MSYKKLKIWQMAKDLSIDIHQMTMTALPKHELYEEGSQIRRAIKSVRSNIVEGYGRRDYKREFLRYLVTAHASCDEALDHLEILHETGSLTDDSLYKDLHSRMSELGKALGGFRRSVDAKQISVREDSTKYCEDI
jgi:four helix bundle protein